MAVSIASVLAYAENGAAKRSRSIYPAKPAPEPLQCFGDQHRASLQVGAPPPIVYAHPTPEHTRHCAKMTAAWIKRLLPSLPDLVAATTLADRPDAPIALRHLVRAARIAKIGAALIAAGLPKLTVYPGSRKVYAIRRKRHYAKLGPTALGRVLDQGGATQARRAKSPRTSDRRRRTRTSGLRKGPGKRIA